MVFAAHRGRGDPRPGAGECGVMPSARLLSSAEIGRSTLSNRLPNRYFRVRTDVELGWSTPRVGMRACLGETSPTDEGAALWRKRSQRAKETAVWPDEPNLAEGTVVWPNKPNGPRGIAVWRNEPNGRGEERFGQTNPIGRGDSGWPKEATTTRFWANEPNGEADAVLAKQSQWEGAKPIGRAVGFG